MKRLSAIKHLGVVSGGLILLPCACAEEEVALFSNLQSVKNNEQLLIGRLSNYILSEDPINFSTPEPRSQFVLTMINDCSSESEIDLFTRGLKAFQKDIGFKKNKSFLALNEPEQEEMIQLYFESESLINDFLVLIKKYSLLHFETSENYLTTYLKYEFMPGRYLGQVSIT